VSLREGYKETEIGIIPEDWKLSNLKDLVLDMHQGINTVTENIKYHDTGIDILQAKHITSGYIDFSDPRKVSNEDYVKYKDKYQPKLNHILLTNIGTIGKVILVREKINFLIAWNLFLIKSNEQMINPNFLLNFFKKLDSEKYYDRFLTGNATKFINKKFMGDIKIPLPPLEEQKKIADILSTIDQKIDLIDTQINDTGVLKKGLMQKLLTQGIRHSKFKESEIGRIPAGWEVQQLGDLTSLTAGGTPSTTIKEYWTPKEIPWLSSGEVNKKIVHDTDNMISENGLKNSAAKLVPKNSILIALAGQGKTRGTVAITEIELTTNQSVASILPSEKLEMYFIYHNLNARYEELRSMSTGAGGRGGLNLAILKSVKIALPPLEEQKQISQILSTTDEKLSSLREKKEAYETLKKGLMQKLLTGEVRVK
jgi:type I restriction enzyme S subunit